MTTLSLVIAVLSVLLAGVTDARTHRIPNWLTLTAALSGIVVAGLALGPRGALASAFGFGLGLLALMPIYVVRGLGAGDVKLFAAIGALLGPSDLLPTLVATAIAGGLMAVGMLAARGGTRLAVFNVGRIAGSLGSGRLPDLTLASPAAVRLPYGVAIAAGTLAAVVGRHVVHTWPW